MADSERNEYDDENDPRIEYTEVDNGRINQSGIADGHASPNNDGNEVNFNLTASALNAVIESAVTAALNNLTMINRSQPPNQVRDAHVIPISEISHQIPVFEGTNQDHGGIESWLRRVEAIQRASRTDDLTMAFVATNRLTGKAREWYDNSPELLNLNWQQLRERMSSRFGSEIDKITLYDKMRARRWNTNEKIEDYVHEKSMMMNRLGIEDSEKISLLIRGIDHDVIRLQLRSNPPRSTDEFQTRARILFEELVAPKLEKGLQLERRPPKPRDDPAIRRVNEPAHATIHQNRMYRKPRCHICDASDHLKPNCPHKEKGLRCYICSQFGHRAVECPKRPATAQASTAETRASIPRGSNEINYVDSRTPTKYHKMLKIKDEEVQALVDSGSACTLIRARVKNELELPAIEKETDLRGLNRQRLLCSEVAQLSFELDGRDYQTEAVVVPETAVPVDVLLGRNFLNTTEYCVYKNEVIFNKMRNEEDTIDAIFAIEIEPTEPRIDVNPDLPLNVKERIQRLMASTRMNKLEKPAKENDVQLKIELESRKAVRHRPRRYPWPEAQYINERVEEMMKRGIIRPSRSDYASPVVITKKKNGEYRFCVDYRDLNKITVRDNFPLPHIEDLMATLSNKRYFTTLDLKDGFHHVTVEPESVKYTSFVTPDGQYEYVKMPFGLVNGSSVFQRFLNKIFEDFLRKEEVLLYMDDLLIPTETIEKNIETLEKVLERCEEHCLELKIDKCRFLYSKTEYLGYRIEDGTMKPGIEKTKAIDKFPTPRTVQNVRAFLGLTGYFRKFIKNFSKIAAPLSELTKKQVDFQFGEKEREAFDRLKKELVNEPTLRFYDRDAETELHTDASIIGLGAILLQKADDNEFHPVSYLSWKTNPTERRYPSFKLEALAVIKALKKLRPFLLGLRFKIVTDCAALKMALEKKEVNRQISEWALTMSEFDYTIEHRPGTKMNHADCLSRTPIDTYTIERDNDYDRIRAAQEQDEEIRRLKELVNIGKAPSGLKIVNGKLVKEIDSACLMYVPRCLRRELIMKTHEDLCHLGAEKVLYDLRKTFYFPRMKKFTKKRLANCIDCLRYNPPTARNAGLLHNITKTNRPWNTIHIDHLGPLEKSESGNRHVFEVVDAFTKMVFLEPTKTTGTNEVVKILETLFKIFGTPERIISDRGTCFTSTEFERFCEAEKVRHVKIAVQTPRANGQAERFNKVIMPALLKTSPTDRWDESLRRVQTALNNSVSHSTGRSPVELMFGYKMRDENTSLIEQLRQEEEEERFIERRRLERETAATNICKRQESNKRYYDSHRRPAKKFEKDDLVMILRTAAPTGCNPKMAPKYGGPYRIKRVLNNDRYVVSDLPNHQVTQKPYEAILPPERLRKIPSPDDSSESEIEDRESDESNDEVEPCKLGEHHRNQDEDDRVDVKSSDGNGNELDVSSHETNASNRYQLRQRRASTPVWASLMKRGRKESTVSGRDRSQEGPSCRRRASCCRGEGRRGKGGVESEELNEEDA